MRFWDSSAVVPLLIDQPATAVAESLVEEVPGIVLWWSTPVACSSALARLRREGRITTTDEMRLQGVIDALRDSAVEMQPTDSVRATARRLVRTHALRASDALQLAAAIAWAGTPDGHVFVTFDERLADAARLEGFVVAPQPAL